VAFHGAFSYQTSRFFSGKITGWAGFSVLAVVILWAAWRKFPGFLWRGFQLAG